jgi:predicted DCC family thiol-disulfide oxidoreductase YuxK
LQLIIFYDGQCPLCLKEMRHLMRLDKDKQLRLIDIYGNSFVDEFPEMQDKPVLQKLHGYLVTSQLKGPDSRQLLTGLDVTYHAWRLAGKGWMVKPLRWPVIRTISDYLYLWFARHRFRLSYLLTGQRRCNQCQLKDEL